MFSYAHEKNFVSSGVSLTSDLRIERTWSHHLPPPLRTAPAPHRLSVCLSVLPPVRILSDMYKHANARMLAVYRPTRTSCLMLLLLLMLCLSAAEKTAIGMLPDRAHW